MGSYDICRLALVVMAASGAGCFRDDSLLSGKNPCGRVPADFDRRFCGSSDQNGFAPDAADSVTIYSCKNGHVESTVYCAQGCHLSPGHKNDFCDDAQDPCANVLNIDNGSYCGRSTQGDFDPAQADAETLYECKDGQVVSASRCANRCVVSPARTPDYCQ
jgi:hypothetical protein